MHLLHRITVYTTSPSTQISYLSLCQFQCLHFTMAESISEVSSRIFQAGFKWGDMSFNISASSIEVVKEICGTAVKISAVGTVGTIGAIYGYPLLKTLIDAAVAKAFGGDERDDQEIREIRPGSLHVLLRCFTEARFLEVLEDYESGKIKQRVEKEFLNVGIKTTELVVEMKNMKEVKERKAAIKER